MLGPELEKYISYESVLYYFDINNKLPDNKKINNINWYAIEDNN